MADLLFMELAPQIEKEAGGRAKLKVGPVATVGIFLLLLLGVVIALYAMKQAEAARLVLDLAIAFFTWCTGRAVGEKAGLERPRAKPAAKKSKKVE
jgi:hypothetical protein